MDQKKYLSPKELAQLIGVSKLTIYGWTSRQEIPFYRIGRLVRFNAEAIDNWLNKKKVEPYKM